MFCRESLHVSGNIGHLPQPLSLLVVRPGVLGLFYKLYKDSN